MDNPKPAPRNNRNTRNRNKNRDRDRDRGKSQGQDSSQLLQSPTASVSSPNPDVDVDIEEVKPKDDESINNNNKNPGGSGKRKEAARSTSPVEHKNPVPTSSSSTSKRFGDRDRFRSRPKEPHPISIEDDDDDDDLDLDASDLKRQIDRLERDLQRRDRELDEERVETEKCMESIKRLERDKVELKREIEGLKDEGEDYKRTLDEYKERATRDRSRNRSGGKLKGNKGGMMMIEDDIDSGEDVNGYYADRNGNQNHQLGFDIAVQQKNREIEQLIEDNERLDEEKTALEEKLNVLKESLSEATKQIESMTNDHFEFKSQLLKADEKIKQLQEEKTVLSIRERELLGYKERHDQYLENLCNAVDIRVDVWKKIMFDKDEEIDRLNAKISTLMSQIPNTQMDSERSTVQLLNHKLVEREHQIALLNEQLTQATEEIESNSNTIESLQSKLNLTQDSKKTEQLVKSLQTTVRKLEDKLNRRSQQLSAVENEAEEKSRTLTSLIGRMAAYESHTYGLPEAVSEIKDLKTQIRIRDKQVEAVTQDINVLQMQVNDLQEENEMLRDKLGLDNEADVNRETRRYIRTKKNECSALRSKVAHLEEEVVTLKTRNYSLKKQLHQYDLGQQQIVSHPHYGGGGSSFIPDRDGPDGGSVSSPKMGSTSVSTEAVTQGDMFVRNLTGFGIKTEEWKEKYEIILEENSSLRRGLHEILDCMHKMTDDGNAEVMIQAPVLEELLREMSSRGIINYPFPISSFHMKVSNLEGKCSQLRDELHRLRQDERQCRQELFEAQGVIQTLHEQLQSKIVVVSNVDPAQLDTTNNNNIQDQEDKLLVVQSTSTTEILYNAADPAVLQNLQQQIELLQSQNESLKNQIQKQEISKDKTIDNECQTEDVVINIVHDETLIKTFNAEKKELIQAVELAKIHIAELEGNIRAKEDALNEIRLIRSQQERDVQSQPTQGDSDLQDALVVARDTISSLQKRIQSKEEIVNQYRRLLAEVRTEMTTSAERHVQEMRALQMTIHQQQQAFTRMKSTLSQPVKDSGNVDGTIKDQLTRIHELEDEVSQLQHAMSNTAAQLTAARSEAHRWRCHAEAKIKEIESVRDEQQVNMEHLEEFNSVRQELRETYKKLDEAQQQLATMRTSSARESMTELVNVLRSELEEKDKQIDAYSKSLHNLKNSGTYSDKSSLEERLHTRETELNMIKEEVKELHRTVSAQQVKISKNNAINQKSGVSFELEELRGKHRDLTEAKAKLDKELANLNKKRDEEEIKKIKSAETVARWEEGKKWKKNMEKQETRIRELEGENDRFKRTSQNLRITITRMEKEKNL